MTLPAPDDPNVLRWLNGLADAETKQAYQQWRTMLSGTSPERLMYLAFIAGCAWEREECAKIADEVNQYGLSDGYSNSNDWWSGTDRAKEVIARLIRERGDKPEVE